MTRIAVIQRKWRTLRRQRLQDVRFIAECMGVLLLSTSALRLIGLRRWTRVLARHCPTTTSPSTTTSGTVVSRRPVSSVYRSVEIACRNLPHVPTCLPRAVTLWWALRRHGVPSELQLGVKKEGQNIEAHASVVCGQFVFYDRRRAGYKPFARRLRLRR